MSELAPKFLSRDDVLRLHLIAIADQGGDPTVRDMGLLDSALAQPKQQFGGEYAHPDIPAMAAAYAFHICGNHPFVDGNKRAGVAAMIAFLTDNGWSFNAEVDEAEQIILSLASGKLSKEALADWVRKSAREKAKMELRDFFRNINPEQMVQHWEAFSASQNTAEQNATLDEASAAIPAIDFFLRGSVAADNEQTPTLALIAVTLSALYRTAEDMGYEW